MKKNDVWNEEINPDFISDVLENLNSKIWDRGYFKETEEGVWYEMYVNKDVKKKLPKININKESSKLFSNLKDIIIDHYHDDNQITFFQPKNENKYTFVYLENLFS